MGRNKKGQVTWKMTFNDFKDRYPEIGRNTIYWCAYNYSTIYIVNKGFKKLTYNYDTKEVKDLK